MTETPTLKDKEQSLEDTLAGMGGRRKARVNTVVVEDEATPLESIEVKIREAVELEPEPEYTEQTLAEMQAGRDALNKHKPIARK